MATLTIRNLDENLKLRLRLEAAQHGRSMEEEVRAILRSALEKPPSSRGLGSRIHQRFSGAGGIELDLPSRADPVRAANLKR